MNNEYTGTSQCFSFLRYALGMGELPDFSKVDWNTMFNFAKRQALVGVMFEGVQHLPKELAPKGRLLFEWIAQSEAIRRQNIRLNKATFSIYENIQQQGKRCCILKGQGNALLYTNPHSRTPGDVDVWVSVKSRKELPLLAASLVKEESAEIDESYYHVGLMVDGVEVELHPVPAVLANPIYNHRLQKWLKKNSEIQFENRVELPNVGRIAIPTIEFNLVYQLLHLYHHYFYEGIGLRQFVDYLLLIKSGEPINTTEVVNTWHALGIYGFARGVMWVLGEVFGLAAGEMLAPADERRGRLLLNDILRGGNFGHYDHRYAKSGMGHNLQRLKRDWDNLFYYPHEALAEPWFRLWHYCWRKLQ